MKKLLATFCAGMALCFLASCAEPQGEVKSYNQGINIIPTPQSLVQHDGFFRLGSNTAIAAASPEAKTVAEFFAAKMRTATGLNIQVAEKGNIQLSVDPSLDVANDEGYTLDVTKDGAVVVAKTAQGLFYGMQSFLQLLPAEIESPSKVNGIAWQAPAVSIKDAPRFGYRGIMLDPCRHFMPVENVKKYLDVLSLFKMNRMHWHLTDDQGWRIEIKKYPKLTEIASKRIDGEGTEHSGYYTQEEIKEIVKYAADRFITVVPELELPGHEMAAIAAYPNLSCKGEQGTPRVIWGVEDIVMCPGKEDMFTFLQDVIDEMVPLFPSEYFHIGGDECPKISWKNCPLCQKRIKEEGLKADSKHSAEERLQSYVIQRMEKYLATKGKKIIGWDEILEGGLAPSATVMSWRGEDGGIAAALMDHTVIMTPGGNGMYLDAYQGDSKIEPVTIGGYTLLEKTYSYDPIPDTLVAMGKSNYILGVQGNTWSEYMYDEAKRDYMVFPRILAVAEIGWTNLDRKDYKDFERRIENAYVRLDGHAINYHIPQPEQPNGSCNFVAFTDKASLEFKTTRPIKMVYTLDGSEPTPASTAYTAPIEITETTTLKIASVLPSGKMSPIRTIQVEKQSLAPAKEVAKTTPGLNMEVTDGMYLNVKELEAAQKETKKSVIKDLKEIRSVVKTSESMRGVNQYAAVATGYVNIPEDGVYFISSDLEEVWIDGKLLVNNGGEVKRFSRHDSSVALAKGLHEIKAVFLGHIIGGWPSNWNDGSIKLRKSDAKEFTAITPEMLCH
ncbi:MAG: family 20 glycosylhydrolase [Parabacteroides sp.]|uniref:beta-N-acetylhexosaminidase n=1 Tax=Parabacteroides faecalis TaxID=2924040 RepID=A0ABT0BWH8_9BACT|nr:family 20 glycosylhydrolase [Parabacteroides faecalis]MCI7286762.1 family 20 glycosylhydrolase [Parabacteroides sp.]MDY5621923.1 family 20 glycosylhydrolase [Bacteroidales bacterium]CDE59818.1 glycoside hydrolase family 20 candidate beta-N-acetylhexosaminidase [Parabacteroides sp. CAG:409]MCI7358202.1 family 20 glycosylhydrolase [Parabacteroides sp.]MCI7707500.1 family 20 glycosylhydrolase [Parabacteroides sp.]